MPRRFTNYLLALWLTLTSLAHATDPLPASCQTTSPSNFFTYHVPTDTLAALGFQTQAQNLVGLTRDPHSQVVYATAGLRLTRLYTIDPPTGHVTAVGPTGVDPVVALATQPNGRLWGWSTAGLLQLNPTTGAGTLIDKAANHTFQTLAWQPSGTTLYATAATTSGEPSTLWQWDGKKWQTTCSNLPPQVQGLQARADGLLVLDYRQATQLHVDLYDVTRCQTVARTTLPPLALTVPTSACTIANLTELQAVLDQAQAHDDVIINDWTLPSDSDLTNQDGQDLTTYCGRTQSESWIGTGTSLPNSYLGLRFHGPTIPARAQILAATLQLTNNHSTQEVKTAFEVRAELAPAPAPFLCTAASAPGLRPTTTSSGSYTGNDKWMKHALWPIDVTAPVTDWVRGGFASDTLALIAKGTGSPGGRKFFYNAKKNNLDLKTLPTLTIAYRLPPVVSNAQALQTFLESLAGFESFQLAPDGILTVKLHGQTHRGVLTSQVVAGPPPADGILHLVPVDDRNGDGIADYELLYPSGDRQLAYYLGIEKPPEVLPPDPSTVATPIDPTVASLFDNNIAFLYRGTTPIQTGVAPNTFDPLRVAVIRGQVRTRDQQPLSGVLLNHPPTSRSRSNQESCRWRV